MQVGRKDGGGDYGQQRPTLLFGVLNPRTGTRLLFVRHRNRAQDFRSFLAQVRRRYRRWPILMILDQASSHTAKATQSEAERLRITFGWLPTACPELNPTELLWQRGKANVSANRAYASVDEQADVYVEYLLHLSSREALQAAGTRSPTFWLFAPEVPTPTPDG